MWRAALQAFVVAALGLLVAASAMAGQQELMDAWAKKKQAVTNEVYERLRQEKKLPENGTVEFKAHTRPDPDKPGSLLIEVDEVQLSPAPGSKKESDHGKQEGGQEDPEDPRFTKTSITPVTLELQTLDSSEFITYEELDIPTASELKGRFEVRKGIIMPAPEKQAEWLGPGEKPGEKAPAEP